MRVQAFVSELAVEGFDEAVVRRFARPREVQHDTLLVSPDIEIAGDKLRSLVNADRLGVADGFADALQSQYDILASIAEARIDGGKNFGPPVATWKVQLAVPLSCYRRRPSLTPRREHFIKGKTIEEIARDLKVSRNTVRKAPRPRERSFEYQCSRDRSFAGGRAGSARNVVKPVRE